MFKNTICHWKLLFFLGISQALLGSCLVCTLGGILLILIVLQNYKVPEYHTHTPKHQSSCSFFAEFLVETNHLLLIPIYLGTAAFEIFCYTLFGQVSNKI
jgi:hypothetical protein